MNRHKRPKHELDDIAVPGMGGKFIQAAAMAIPRERQCEQDDRQWVFT